MSIKIRIKEENSVADGSTNDLGVSPTIVIGVNSPKSVIPTQPNKKIKIKIKPNLRKII